MIRKTLAAALCAACLTAAPASAQSEMVGAVTGAVTAQRVSAASQAQATEREGLCSRMLIKLQQGGLPDEPGRRLAESYRSTCADTGR